MASAEGSPIEVIGNPESSIASITNVGNPEFVTEAVLQNWSEAIDGLLATVQKALAAEDVKPVISIFYELLEACSTGSVSVEDCSRFIRSLRNENVDMKEDKNNHVIELFLHVFSLFTLNDSLKQLMLSIPFIDKPTMLLFFEPSMLLELGLVNQMFEKKIVRMNTNLLYKQKRFNLLREESEGYSKLIVEVYTLAYANNNLANRVQTTANSIEAFIGYFDLDPIRSLDIFLDIAAVNLVSSCEFFVQVLKLSPWWPSVPATDITSLQDISKGGNSIAAQLLGFKLSAYDQEPVPENLMMLIAVLIKEGFISLADIYEFLIPSDKDVANYEETWKQNMVKESYLANASALALAAPLTDDDDSKQVRLKQKDDKKDEANEEKKQTDPKLLNQKALLLKSLLSVGSIYPSLFILIKFPFICGPFPELADLINRLVDFIIQPLYQKTRSFECCSEIQVARKLPSSTTKDTVLVDPYPETIKQTLSPLEGHSEGGVEYSFFYENWSNELTQISIENDEESLKQLLQVSENLLKFSGPLLSRDSSLVAKICRIGVYYCKQQPDEFLEFWSEFFRLYLLPCISLLDANPGLLFEIYSLLSKLSFDTRYAMYGEWQQVLLKSNPHLKLASSKAEKNTKDVLKRLSKTNVREMMRKLAKVSYTNPITTFNVFISQVESYDNLADLVVEAARYFTDMGWDALPYAIMTQLSSGRGTYQSSGLHDQKWILSLATFTAKLSRRYSHVDPSPILTYLLKQLHEQDTSVIIVLREIINQMAGISQLSNVSTEQIDGLGGGPSLQSTVYNLIGDRRDSSHKSAKRLIECLKKLGISAELFVILAQIHATFIYNVDDTLAHQKFLAYRYDELTHVLIQYSEMIKYFLDIDDFKQDMLSIPELSIRYGVKASWAFGLWRSILGEEIRRYDNKADVEMADANDEQVKWHPLLKDIIDEIKVLLPDEEWKFLRPGFYVTFWQLSLYDIQYPEDKYQQQEAKLQQKVKELSGAISQLEKQPSSGVSIELKQRRQEKDQASLELTKLMAESKRHALHFSKSKARLENEKQYWFKYIFDDDGLEDKVVRKYQIRKLLAHCILPRVVHSPIDAIFCARFIRLLHSLGTLNFSTLNFYDKLFSDGILYGTLLTCTQYEAENLGLFFSQVLDTLGKWRNDKDLYKVEGLGYKQDEDGNTSYLPGMQFQYDEDINVAEVSLLDFDKFRRALEKWHRHTCNAVIDCLRSEDYMHRRNTITLLKNMISVFPVITAQGWNIYDAIENISEDDAREDLKLSAVALLGHLSRRAGEWIQLYDFKPVSEEQKKAIIEENDVRMRRRKKLNKSVVTSAPSQQASRPPSSASTPVPQSGRHEQPPRPSSSNGIPPSSLPRIPTAPAQRRPDEDRTRPRSGEKENREVRERDSKDAREVKELRDVRNTRDSKVSRDVRDSKDSRSVQTPRDSKDMRDFRELPRDRNVRDMRPPASTDSDSRRRNIRVELPQDVREIRDRDIRSASNEREARPTTRTEDTRSLRDRIGSRRSEEATRTVSSANATPVAPRDSKDRRQGNGTLPSGDNRSERVRTLRGDGRREDERDREQRDWELQRDRERERRTEQYRRQDEDRRRPRPSEPASASAPAPAPAPTQEHPDRRKRRIEDTPPSPQPQRRLNARQPQQQNYRNGQSEPDKRPRRTMR